jgi:hypothetical protein
MSRRAERHSACNAPNLMSVAGRSAAGLPNYPYSQALVHSGLTWDPATLDRFLSSPAAMVSGSSVRMAVTDQDTRANIVAYLQAVGGTSPTATVASWPMTPHPKAGSEDWRQDAPGRVHRINVADLPPPFDTASSANRSRIVPRPKGATLRVPAGFEANVFAGDL